MADARDLLRYGRFDALITEEQLREGSGSALAKEAEAFAVKALVVRSADFAT
jgi:hypothetical protein